MGVPGDPTPNPIFLPPAFVKEICVYIYIYIAAKKRTRNPLFSYVGVDFFVSNAAQ